MLFRARSCILVVKTKVQVVRYSELPGDDRVILESGRFANMSCYRDTSAVGSALT